MRIDLKDKTALVTGSTQGIGYAIAKGLAQSGARVAVNGRTKDKTEAAARSLRGDVAHADILALSGDVSTAASCDALVSALPKVDILVNNAGIFDPADFFEIPDEEWVRFFEVNVLSGIRLARAFMPGMLKRNWGRIVFISSESALHFRPR